MTGYDFLKDFAAPIATVIASFTAASVAAVFAIRQSRAAERQAETAFSKLKHDTFAERLKIYKSVRDILYVTAHKHPLNREDRIVFYKNISSIYEGRFHFRQNTLIYIMQVIEKSQRMVRITDRRGRLDSNSEKWQKNEDEIEELEEWLDHQLSELPIVFQDEMSLSLPETTRGTPLLPDWAATIIIAFAGAMLLVLLGIIGVM